MNRRAATLFLLTLPWMSACEDEKPREQRKSFDIVPAPTGTETTTKGAKPAKTAAATSAVASPIPPTPTPTTTPAPSPSSEAVQTPQGEAGAAPPAVEVTPNLAPTPVANASETDYLPWQPFKFREEERPIVLLQAIPHKTGAGNAAPDTLTAGSPSLKEPVASKSPLAPTTTPAATPAAQLIPPTADSLQLLFEDMIRSLVAGDTDQARRLASSFGLPRPREWFVWMFGDEQGEKWAPGYEDTLASLPDLIIESSQSAVEKGRLNVKVRRMDLQTDPKATRSQRAAMKGMYQPTPLYAITFSNPRRASDSVELESFVYAGGGFRYLGQTAQFAEPRP